MKTYHIIGWGLLTAAACLLPSPARADSSVVATVGGTPITAAEIEQALRLPLYDLEVEKYRLTRRKLDQTIVERLPARAAGERGQTVSAYVTAEVQPPIATLTPEEIAARVRAGRTKLPPDPGQAHQQGRGAPRPQRRRPKRPTVRTSRASSGLITTPSLSKRPISNRRITCSWPSV